VEVSRKILNHEGHEEKLHALHGLHGLLVWFWLGSEAALTRLDPELLLFSDGKIT
jgi:hypothetical protein